MKILYEHEKATISYNEDVNAIELTWKIPQDPESYMEVFNKVLEYIKEFGTDGFLSDIRNQGVVGTKSSNWLQTEIMPQAFEAGLKKIAVIMDKDVFKKFYINNIEKSANGNLMNYFDSREDAINWLTKIK